jgi:hypothetical protein
MTKGGIANNISHPASIQADKALSGASGGFSWFGGRSEKYENAADLYTQAANAFRVQKMSEPPRVATSVYTMVPVADERCSPANR